jgi:hypothetical protein
MSNPFDFAQRHFDLLFAAAAGWIILVLVASIVYRCTRGKYVLFQTPTGLAFSESWTSGRSLQSWWARMGGARNALFVGVSPEFVYVLPQFPFNLLFLPEVYGLEHVIPRGQIRRIVSVPSLLGNEVRVEFNGASGASNELALKLRQPEQFLHAIGSR